ncbi:class A beta-lactamase-related serine hydrolase [Mycetocola manganoxydans]|uniref:Class A beta-lactamase-related serine hydrolase n=1 Tax=Mycetocola manganoxydans TaxID=699879 RepID=A0A3L6ZYP7_9MICO|nr:serine hydrolase domain-containing protein [Mycetocola manganoxydans]RLP73049.1 class A beta-lactamase-related serine hydrolase [Mycetocola manganoxydans]
MRTHTARGRRAALLTVAAAVVLGLSACAGATASTVALPEQPDGDLPSASAEALDTALAEAMALAAAPGAIAGVWAPWSGQWVSAAGVTAPGGSEKMSTDMRFRVGDNTQPMTCDVLYGLVGDGTVELGDAVSDYLPSIRGLDGITLGQLCHGTAGLGDFSKTIGPLFPANPTRQWSTVELVSDGIASKRTGEPGVAYAPSDTNYAVLGMALEEASGSTAKELYGRYVFDRLGMNDSLFPEPSTLEIAQPFAPGWHALKAADGSLACDTPKDQTLLSSSLAFTAGGVVSTLDDMNAYVRSFATSALLDDDLKDDAWKTVSLSTDAPNWQQFGPGGLQMGPLRGQAGYIPGHISAMLSDPATGLTVVVMLNNSTAGAGFAQNLAMKLASIAAKATPAKGKELPVVGLPWSEAQMTEKLVAGAVCQPEG